MTARDPVYLAIDLGASGGRVVAAEAGDFSLSLQEVFRFDNAGILAGGVLYWDLLGLWQKMLDGLARANQQFPGRIRSVGVDTWGVDFGLLDANDQLLANPIHYRHAHTAGIFDSAFRKVPREEIFHQTGLQFMELNTLFQLLAMQRDGSVPLQHARRLLMMPDLFHWLLSGQKSNERTNASTTQLFDPVRGDWALDLIRRFELPVHLFGPIQNPGATLGPLAADVVRLTGLRGAQVVLPASHDTASAVWAVPVESAETESGPDWCYISCGTWSLMGVELRRPRIDRRVAELNFTNEAGVGGTTRLLKNIAGLWLLQGCRASFRQRGVESGWDQWTRWASEASPLRSLIDPDHPSLHAPDDMCRAIAELCKSAGEPIPESPGQLARCVLESLALKHQIVLGWLEELVGGPIARVHMVGGGVQNPLLCQWTADACGRPVIAGPVEATALGNLLVQAAADRRIPSPAFARRWSANTAPPVRYNPDGDIRWSSAIDRFRRLASRDEGG